MPVPLPLGVLPAPIYFAPRDVLTTTRVSRFRFDLMDGSENLIQELDSVMPGGSAEWQLYTAVKGGGQMTVRDTGTDHDWLNARIRPTVIFSGPGTEPAVEQPLGVFLIAAAPEKWDDLSRTWELELVDKLSILDTAIATKSDGMPIPYVAPAGANIIDTVTALIQGQGEATPAIEPDPQTLPNALTFEVGESLLFICNELLKAGGYSSLWCDGAGQYRCQPDIEPQHRPPVYESSRPFTRGDTSVMGPEWDRDRNIYDVPNLYVAISQGDGESEAMVAIATNTNPDSPYSYQARGSKWKPRVLEGVEVASMAALQNLANQGLAQTTAVTAAVTAEHLFLPDMLIGSVVQLNPDPAVDYLCLVTRLSVPFDPVAMCSSDLREVAVT